MKLQQLQEAGYSGEHPLITQIKQAVDDYKRTTIKVKASSIQDSGDLISNELGEPKVFPPHDGSFVQYEWRTNNTSGLGSVVTLTDQRWFAVVHVMPY